MCFDDLMLRLLVMRYSELSLKRLFIFKVVMYKVELMVLLIVMEGWV